MLQFFVRYVLRFSKLRRMSNLALGTIPQLCVFWFGDVLTGRSIIFDNFLKVSFVKLMRHEKNQ